MGKGSFTRQRVVAGRRAYLTRNDELVAKTFVSGRELENTNRGGHIVHPGPGIVSFFDDFHGDLVADELAYIEVDTGAAMTGVVVTGTNGIFRLTNAQPQHSDAVQALSTDTFLQWKPDQGGNEESWLHYATRVRLNSVNKGGHQIPCFFGFNDTGGGEIPAFDTGGAHQSNSGDYMGFALMHGTSATNWQAVTRQGGGTAQRTDLGVGPTEGAWDQLQMRYEHDAGDTGGSVVFYVNGVAKAQINNPITKTVALTHWQGGYSLDTGAADSKQIDIDYVNVAAPRDTGS